MSGLRRRGEWWAARTGRAPSCRAQVIVPQVDVDRGTRRRLRTPQVVGLEAHAVAVLRFAPESVARGVREHPHAVVKRDDAALAARVAGQPRMADRVDVA